MQDLAIIIVPGLEAPKWPWPFNYLIQLYCWFFDLRDTNNNWMAFKEYLVKRNLPEVLLFKRPESFTNHQIAESGKRLAETIKLVNSPRIILFGHSLGTAVIEMAVNQLESTSKITKIISVASPHRFNKLNLPASIQIVNVYSPEDHYLVFANRMLYGGGSVELENAENIVIPDTTHSEFSREKLFDFYFKLITKP